MPDNVLRVGHVGTGDHNAFNTSPQAVLNVARDTMAANGFSPATRVFEAAGAGGCLITDAWEGIELFLEPGEEVLVTAPGELGHEGWGVIDAVGDDVEGLAVGDRVACLSHRSYAEYDVADAGAVVRLPESLRGMPFPGEPLGCAMNIFRRAQITVRLSRSLASASWALF